MHFLMKSLFLKFGYVKYVSAALKSIILHVWFRLEYYNFLFKGEVDVWEKKHSSPAFVGKLKISANKCVIIHELSVVIRVCHIFIFI